MASKFHDVAYLAGLLAKSAHQGVTISTAAGTIIVVLHDNGLLAGIPAGEQDDHLASLRKINTQQYVSLQLINNNPLYIIFIIFADGRIKFALFLHKSKSCSHPCSSRPLHCAPSGTSPLRFGPPSSPTNNWALFEEAERWAAAQQWSI